MPDNHVQVLGQQIVDVEIIRRGFQQGFAASVSLGNFLKVRVKNTDLFDHVSVFVADGQLSLPLVDVDS